MIFVRAWSVLKLKANTVAKVFTLLSVDTSTVSFHLILLPNKVVQYKTLVNEVNISKLFGVFLKSKLQRLRCTFSAIFIYWYNVLTLKKMCFKFNTVKKFKRLTTNLLLNTNQNNAVFNNLFKSTVASNTECMRLVTDLST